ncbi:TPA: hypothetical protein ACH3X2_009802 [Trebouxia sp. C0005]
MLDPFEQRRQQVLDALSSQETDKSRAGGVDARITLLVDGMNKHLHLYTTSSCSGRISVFAEPSAATRAAGKKGGEWVYATHDLADGPDVLACIQQRMMSGAKLIFRFEPFILAAECRDMSIAQQLVSVAREAGFRESGVTATKARIIAGIRCSLRLEVPVADAGRMLVDEAYLQKYLVDFGNEKMEANWARTTRLHHLFQQKMLQQEPLPGGVHKEVTAKRNTKGSIKSIQEKPAAKQSHLSSYAFDRLIAAGVSTQLLHQIQASPHSISEGIPSVTNMQKAQNSAEGSIRGNWHSVGRSKGSPDPKASSKADFRKAAHLLEKRQEDILRRLTCLEEDQAQRREVSAGSKPEACLKWQILTPKLLGMDASALNRWGHSATLCEDKLVLFGGYGGAGAHSRTADVLIYDCKACTLSQPTVTGPCPPSRMGHTAVLYDSTLVVFGGRISPAQPLNDVWALDVPSCTWHCIHCKGIAPSARFRHTAVAFGSRLQDGVMIVHGGYDGKQTFSDTWKLSTADWTWQQMATRGSVPGACHSHAAAVVRQRMFISGGTQDYQHTFSGLHAMDLVTGTWQAVKPQGGGPSSTSCFSHSMTAVGALLVVAGGCHTLGAGHIYSFDLNSNSWSKHSVLDSSTLVLCRHTATAAPDQRSIIVLGGGMNCFGFGTTFSPPVQLDLTPLMRSPAASQNTVNTAQLGYITEGLTRHIGQSSIEHEAPTGAAAQLKPSGHVTEAAKSPSRGHSGAGSLTVDTPTGSSGNRQQSASHAVTQPGHKTTPVATGIQSGERLGLAVTRREAKVAKDALKALGWLDQSCKAHTDTQTGCVCLPITDEASTALASLWPGSNGSMTQHESVTTKPGGSSHGQDACMTTAEAEAAAAASQSLHGCMQDGMTSIAGANLPIADGESEPLAGPQSEPERSPQSMAKGSPQPEPTGSHQSRPKGSRPPTNGDSGWEPGPDAHAARLLGLLQHSLAVVNPMQMHTSDRHQGGPAARLRSAVTHILQQQGFAQQHAAQLLSELPTRWEKLGDLALLPRTCMASPDWGGLGQPLWRAVVIALGVERLAMQALVANTGTRDSQAHLLLGDSGWVQHKEGGVVYSLDVTKCMFSSGNTTERQRMGKLACCGETVVDLYAGIGYYTLPLLCKAGAARVIACEWNPNAIEALHRNLKLNGVADRCQVLEGDCTLIAPKGLAARVILGLLPSSQGGWATALEALKADTGGWLHLHHNVTDSVEAEWCLGTLATLQQLARQLGRNWQLRLDHCERVKWYAPHIRHLVLDVHVQPADNVQQSVSQSG